MTLEEAKTFGRNQALIKTAIAVLVMLLFFFYEQTHGDFANGILFFLEAITSVRFIGILIILFGLTFIFGKRAGKAIMLDGKPFVPIAIKYALIIVLFITVPAFVLTIMSGLASTDLQEFTLAFLLGTLFWILPMLLVWLWATNRMRVVAKQSQPTQSADSATAQ
ncbi:hypothetical protein VRU48_13700 [Pedobacter sp. KR3-3]|uniref:Uncharacterized protein n=1 Tax=Pedobacter albus TaxID=3113905 RepID=A0ABU7I9L8_9SPHI|nr:hypothetical protein [Pedobacter sp. KR3-3]MEE1946172.1 hypothetical protein [Pedobacter sp. KR3-3]